MTVAVDEDTVREFVTIISEHADELAKSNGKPGVLQLTRLSPIDEKLVPSRFKLDDIDGMVRAAVAAANAKHNVYIEGRTVRSDLRGAARGPLADTEFVFGLVIDADHDKGKERRSHGPPQPDDRDVAGKLSLLVSSHSAARGWASEDARRRHPRCNRRRPRHRRRQPALSCARHA